MTDDDRLHRIASEIFDDGVVLSTEWTRKHYGLTEEEMARVMEMLEEDL